ncbi:MAG: hypothetical protein G8345_21005, partial [Magnetococcales bacterium]|nr:hypothetical protein [Magnetococcales bacterium]
MMDWVGSGDSVDFYRFALTAPTSNFSLILSNLTADASVQLLRGTTSINIGLDETDAGDQVYMATGLSAGTYTVAVMRDGSAQTNYSLQLQAIAGALDVDNTTGNAQLLDVADGPVEFQQSLTTSDAGDMYSFVVDTASNVTALLSGLAANADIRLLSGAGATLATAASTGRDTESLTYGGLAVGNYFIQVYGSSVTTNYNLQVLTSSDNRSDSATRPTNLGSVGANQAITGYVSWAGDTIDYYSFVVDSSGTWVNLQLEGAPGSLNFTLTGGDLANPLVGEGDGSGATPISVQLNAGTYFVQVGAATESSSVYSLNVTGTVGDLGGSTTGAAYNMGVIGGEVWLSDWVGSSDTVDFYRFTLAASGNVAIFLNGLMADADLYLTNATGSVQAYSVLGGDEDERIIRGLAAGTYYARVNQFAGDTSYQLGLMLTSGDQAGNGTTSSPSLNLGELLGFESVNDWVGTGDTRDAYQFSLSGSSYVNIELSGLSADVDVLLSNGATTITSSLRGVASDEVTLELSAGTYSVVVQQVAGDSNYTLNLSSVSVDNSITGNDNSTTAENLGTITSVNVVYGWVGDGAAFDEDWYSFSVNTNSMVGFYLSNMTGDADLAIYNQDGTLAYFSGNWGNDSEEISVAALAAGTYYVQVDQVAGDSAYELWYYAFNAENVTTAVQNLGSILGVEEINGWVGTGDNIDLYSIVATATSYLSLYLNELTADADLQLLSSTGATLNTSAQLGTMADAINTTVTSGTYYVRVYQYSGDTSYRLQIAGALATADNNNATLGVQSLGVLAGQQQLYGWVGVGDSVDFYRFALTGASNVDLRLWGMAADADMYLLNQAGSVISSSLLDNAQDETISQRLTAGTYYVRVSQYSGSTAYGLTLSASSGNDSDNNNATTNAQQLGVVDGRIIADGWIGNTDGIDTYSFALSENTNLVIAMSGLAADADMQLLNSSGATIGWSFNGGTSDESINQALTAGIYYLQVYRYNGNTNYHLELSAVDSTVIDDNNATTQATSLGILAGVLETSGWVGNGDTQDFYR